MGKNGAAWCCFWKTKWLLLTRTVKNKKTWKCISMMNTTTPTAATNKNNSTIELAHKFTEMCPTLSKCMLMYCFNSGELSLYFQPFCISSGMKELDVHFPLNWSSSWDSRAQKANRTWRQRTEAPAQQGWQQVSVSNVFNRRRFHPSDCCGSVCSQLAPSTKSPFTSPSATLQQTL